MQVPPSGVDPISATPDEFGATLQVGQTAVAGVVGGDTTAVIGDLDDQFVTDGDLDDEMLGAGVPHRIADRLDDDRLRVFGDVVADRAERSEHAHGGLDVPVLGEDGDRVLDLPTEARTGPPGRLQRENCRADLVDRRLQIIDGVIEAFGDLAGS